MPASYGTVAVAGHRTTYGAPFRSVDKLKKGDKLTMYMPYGRFTYTVDRDGRRPRGARVRRVDAAAG